MDPVFSPGTYLAITGGTLTGALTIGGVAPSSVSSGQVAIGGGQILTSGSALFRGAGSDTVAASAYIALNDPANGRGAIWQLGGARQLDLWMHNDSDWLRTLRIDKNGVFTFYGTDPGTVSAGQVAIGGGIVRAADRVCVGSSSWSFAGVGSDAYLTRSGLYSLIRLDGTSGNGVVRIEGSAPTSVDSAQVAIGGGQVWTARGVHVKQGGAIYGDGLNLYRSATDNVWAIVHGSDTNMYIGYHDSSPSSSVTALSIHNVAPADTYYGHVAIGGGVIRAATAIYCPTPTVGDNSTKVATTAFVSTAVGAATGITTLSNAIPPTSTFVDHGLVWTGGGSAFYATGCAMSSDGRRAVIATSQIQIYTSADSGATWTARDSNRDWRDCAMSSDGSKLVAVTSPGYIYTSTNSGATWTARGSSTTWAGCASSADGTKLVATVYGGQIYTSTDSGVTWTARDSSRYWTRVCSSSDGVTLYAIENASQIYKSTDSGVTWTAKGTARAWVDVKCSSNGRIVIACVNNGYLYTSNDGWDSTTQRDSSRYWASVACSADGTRMLAAVGNSSPVSGYIYTSINSGESWTQRAFSTVWGPCAMSSDGSTCLVSHGYGSGVPCYSKPSLVTDSATMISTTTSFGNGAAAASGTLTNAPAAGNPTKWIPINDNGTTRYIPAW